MPASKRGQVSKTFEAHFSYKEALLLGKEDYPGRSMIGIRAALGLSSSREDHKNLPPSKTNDKRAKTPRRPLPLPAPELDPDEELLVGGTPGEDGCGIWFRESPSPAELRAVRSPPRSEWLTGQEE